MLCILPVIVRGNKSAARVADLEHGILQGVRDPRRGERRPNRSHHHLVADRSGPANNEAGNQNMIARLDKAARAQIEKLVSRWFDCDKLRRVKTTRKDGGLGPIRSKSESGTAVMIGLDQVAGIVEGQAVRDAQSRGESGLRARGRKFKNRVRTGVRFKDVAGTIDGDPRGKAQTSGESGLRSIGRKLEDRAVAEIRRIKISTGVEGHSGDRAQPGGKSRLCPVYLSEFENIAAAGIRFEQIARTVQGQADRGA